MSQIGAHKHIENQTNDALKRVRLLTQIAAKDAGFVTESYHSSSSKKGIHLSQNLYVIRTVEKEIHQLWNTYRPEEFSLLLITGAAGFGKTSLLWHLFHTLPGNNSHEVWFIKASFLAAGVTNQDEIEPVNRLSHLSIPGLLTAVNALQDQGKKPIILMDTVDLLLHNERNRDHLLEVINNLRSLDCLIIATSRPQEASHLFIHADHKIGLQKYDQQELEKAISNHVNCFYEQADSRENSEHLERILNAVSNGLQIREVCTNPLTLRMLFTLYAPQEVPLEINTYQLYSEFWEFRVVRDHRSGSSYSCGTNLGKIAAMVALCMLIEGTPELTSSLLERRLQDWRSDYRQVSILISRGILHLSEDDTTRFFHQTFFEHCAARGLLFKFKQQSISLLHTRMKSNPNDLFVSPVMEQTLILAENETRRFRAIADNTLLDILKSRHQLLKTSGIYVYIHRRDTTEALEKTVSILLREGENATLNRFLNLAPNMPQRHHRYKTLFKEMDIAWQSNTDEAKRLVLELLERLSSRYPDHVEAFLASHRILEFSPDQWPLGFKKILNIQVTLIKHFPRPKQREAVQTLIEALKRKGTHLLKNRIMQALLRIANILKSTTIADKCEAALKSPELSLNKLDKTILSKLFYFAWQHAAISIKTILAGLDCNTGFFFKSRLYALQEWLLNAGRQEASLAWSHFCNESDNYKKWMWIHIVIPKMISYHLNTPPGERLLKSESSNKNGAILFFREKIKQIFSFWSSNQTLEAGVIDGGIFRLDDFQKIRKALIFANPEKKIFMEILDNSSLGSTSPWLSQDLFGELLAYAYNMGHPGAVKAMELIVQSPGDQPVKLIAIVGSCLQKIRIHDTSVIESSISLYLKTGNANSLLGIIKTNWKLIQEIFPRYRGKINELIQLKVNSTSEKERRSGLALWSYIITFPCPPPLPKAAISLLEKETVNSVKGLIVQLISKCKIETGVDLDMVLELFRPFSTSKDINLRECTINAMLTVLFASTRDPAMYAEQLLDVILAPPVRENLVSRFFRELSGLFPSQQELNVKLMERMISGCNVHLNHNSKQRLFNDLIKPVRKILRFFSLPSVERLLRLVPDVEQYMGRLVLEAACYEHFLDIVPKLDTLLEHGSVHPRVKESIRRHKYHRERTLGGEGWPELEQLLSGRAESLSLPGSEKTSQKILFLAANQRGERYINISKEHDVIKIALSKGKSLGLFELDSKLAVSHEAFRQGLLEYKPQVVHFSGHGTEEGLIVLDENGVFPELMPTEVISELFELYADHIQCVILNACYSLSQTDVIARHIPYVIGMRNDVEDNPAIEFSKVFYETLAAGRTIEDAFKLGRLAVLQTFPELQQHLIPVLLKKDE